jgi:tetratricopeptide (TPR) repeat protein
MEGLPMRSCLDVRALAAAAMHLLVFAGCGPATQPAVTPPPGPSPVALKEHCQSQLASAKKSGKPAFCQGKLAVVGIQPGHGWKRGEWVFIEVARPGFPSSAPAAAFAVTEVHEDAVQVVPLYQAISTVLLDGAVARQTYEGKYERLGKFIGRLKKAQPGMGPFELDMGSNDGVAKGDVYTVLSNDSKPIGRVKVTEVTQLIAYAVRKDMLYTAELEAGLTVVYQNDGAVEVKEPLRIWVLNFDPHDGQDKTEEKVGRTFAKDFADALAGVADNTVIKVQYAENKTVKFGLGEADGHIAARQIGEKLEADIVVWGKMSCNERACASPRYTVVSPVRLQQRGYRGADILFDRDVSGGFSFKGKPPDDPRLLAAALLGSVAYDANMYGDAAYYLELAVGNGFLQGEDALRGRWKLAYSMFTFGQTVAARDQAQRLRTGAQAMKSTFWELRSLGELARIDLREGNLDAARHNLEAIRDGAEKANDDGELAFAIHELGILAARQGRVKEARELYNKSLELKRRIGEVQGEAATLHQLAILEAQQGRVEEARKLYQQSLELKRRIVSVQGEAATLHQLAILEAQQGQVDKARELYNKSLELELRIGNVQGAIATLLNLAALDYQAGKREEARATFLRLLEKARAIKDVHRQADILDWVAQAEFDAGDLAQARAHWTEAKTLYEMLKAAQDVESMTQHLAGLEKVAAPATSAVPTAAPSNMPSATPAAAPSPPAAAKPR